MKTVEIIGYKRANLGKKDCKALRAESLVPCVLYGGEEQIHFAAPLYLFKELIYTPNAYFVNITVDGKEYKAILQDSQYHPVSDNLLHADFLLLDEAKEAKMNIPVQIVGTSPGVATGGKLVVKTLKLKIKALPVNMPEFIQVDVSELALGKTIKVNALTPDNYEILNNPSTSIASIEIPRALRGKMGEEGEEGEEEA